MIRGKTHYQSYSDKKIKRIIEQGEAIPYKSRRRKPEHPSGQLTP
jgi:hypothetical protein